MDEEERGSDEGGRNGPVCFTKGDRKLGYSSPGPELTCIETEKCCKNIYPHDRTCLHDHDKLDEKM